MTKRLLAIGVAMVMVMGLIELASPGDTGAVPVSKTVSGSCRGADPTSVSLINVLGGAPAVQFRVDADVPKTLDPGQSGSPISFTWNLVLDAGLVNKAIDLAKLTSMTVQNTVLDVTVSGPTSTTSVLGRPGPSNTALVRNTPLVVSQGPFTGTLKDVGQSGVVTYKTTTAAFTIVAVGQQVNIVCDAPGLIASTPIKVPGSPDIAQPIEIQAAAGASVPVDVIGRYVTAGKTALVPSSLRVVDGPGSVQNGQVVVSAGGAPSATSVTFEVCGAPVKVADAVAGASEVQHLKLFTGTDLLKKSIGFTLTFDGQETAPIWTATPNFLGIGFGNGPLAFGLPRTKIADWPAVASNYALWTDPSLPTPAAIQSALEALPAIGAGNVAVSGTGPGEYDLTFRGALAQKSVGDIATGAYYSNLPQETLDTIVQGATAALPSGPTTTTTIPAGLSTNDYIAQLILQGRIDEAGRVFSGALLGGIDPQAAIAGLTAVFPSKPAASTTAQGIDPIPERFQDLCSQGSVTVTVAAPPAPPAAVLPAISFSPAPAAKAPPAKYRCSVKAKKVRVRIKGTKKYRTVTKKVRVCTKVKAKKASTRSTKYKKSSKYKKSTKKSSSKKKATVRRSSARRR